MAKEKSKQEIYEEAKKKREEERRDKAEKDKARQSGGSFTTMEPIQYVALEKEKDRIVRLLGNPKLSRNGDPYSAKDIFTSRILGDNDKYFRCNWPDKNAQSNWILWKIYDLVTSGNWVDTDVLLPNGKKKREKKCIYEESHPSIFYRVTKNNRIEQPYEKGWLPAKSVVINVIDRHDMEWHRQNKHTKLLSRNVNVDKNGIAWYDAGVPESLYNTIWDEIVEKAGWFDEYDIAIRRIEGDPYYRVYHAEKGDWQIDENVKQFVVKGSLTDEEKSWEKYNIDSITKVTSYYKIKKNLESIIGQIDKTFNKKFTEELNDFLEMERKEWEKNKTIIDETKPEVPKEIKSEPKKVLQRGESTTESTKEIIEVFSVNFLDKKIYQGIDKLDDKMKAQIIGLNEKDGSLIYSKDSPQLYGCKDKKCNFESPENFSFCPKCGIEFPPIVSK
jgi:hypothetical protein